MGAWGRSLWVDTVGRALPRHEPLAGPTSADVAIVGAGYTGLWTAYHLAAADPTLRIVVVDRADVGFGASGRNGGWCIGELAGMPRGASLEDRRRLARVVADEVDHIGETIRDEEIDCDWAEGGSVRLARNPAQLTRLDTELHDLKELGLGDRVQRLGPHEASRRVGAVGVLDGLWFAPVATLHPLKLVVGLAAAVEQRGVTIHGGTTVLAIRPGVVETDRGSVRAPIIVRATEGYTPTLAGHRRSLAPLASSMIATEPLDAETWAEIGLARHETFADNRHLVIYGQRTLGGRIAFGSRGSPYRFRSRIDPSDESRDELRRWISGRLVELFPALRDAEITHQWSGVLGVPRDWTPSVGFDRARGLAWAGGYVGEGVAASSLAGRTLAALILGGDPDLTSLAWVDHRSRQWEPEPLRWVGLNSALTTMRTADSAEARTGKPARRAALLWRIVGQ